MELGLHLVDCFCYAPVYCYCVCLTNLYCQLILPLIVIVYPFISPLIVIVIGNAPMNGFCNYILCNVYVIVLLMDELVMHQWYVNLNNYFVILG